MLPEDTLFQAVLPAILLGAIAVRALGVWTLRRSATRAAEQLGLRVDPGLGHADVVRGVRVVARGVLHLAGRPRAVQLALEPWHAGALTWDLSVEASPAAPLCLCTARAWPGDDGASVPVPQIHPRARTRPEDRAALERAATAYEEALAALPEDADERRLGRGTVALRQRLGRRDATSPTTVARLAHAAWRVDGAPFASQDDDTSS